MFKVGDPIVWVAQIAMGKAGGGRNGERVGTINEVVPKGVDPRTLSVSTGFKVRPHLSWVVREDVTGKLFWPRAPTVRARE